MGAIRPPQVMLHNQRFKSVISEGMRRYVPDPEGPLYAPASSQLGRIAKIDYLFVEEAVAGNGLCSGCGLSFGDEARILVWESDDEEPPLHTMCAVYALRACPRLRKEAKRVIICEWVDIVNNTYFVHPSTKMGDGYNYLDAKTFLEMAGTIANISGKEAVKIATKINQQEQKSISILSIDTCFTK